MKYKIGIVSLLLFLTLTQSIQSQTQLGLGVQELIFNANNGAAPQVGTAYSIPSAGNLLTWIISFATQPTSHTTILECSNDNTIWATCDTSTNVLGETRSIFTAARFVRATESARSGGSAITVSVVVKSGSIATVSGSTGNITSSGDITGSRYYASDGTASLPAYSFTSNPDTGYYLSGSQHRWSSDGVLIGTLGTGGFQLPATSGQQFLGNDGTLALPAYSFASEPTLGFWRPGANSLYVPPSKIFGVGTYGSGPSIAMGSGMSGMQLSNNARFGFSSTTNEQSVIDTGISRSAAGVVAIGTGAVGASDGTVFANGFIGGAGGAFQLTSRIAITSGAQGIYNLMRQDQTTGSQLKVDALPTIASGFGTSPSITAGSTPLAGSVNVGTGGVASSGVINFGGTAFPTAPFCITTINAVGAQAQAVQSSTTQLTLYSTPAWLTNTTVNWVCISAK